MSIDSDNRSVNFSIWSNFDNLPRVTQLTERFSRGFLQIQPEKLLSSFSEQWLTFFANAGLDIDNINISTGMDFPQDLNRLTPFSINGESALIASDNSSLEGFLNDFISGQSLQEAEPIISYLERRLLSSIEKSWKWDKKIKLDIKPGGWSGEVSIIGHIRVTFTANGFPVIFWIGLGEDSVSLLDSIWKSKLGKIIDVEGAISAITVNIAELSIPPAVLIDYLRIGKEFVIDNNTWPNVTILLNGKLWAEGEIVSCGTYLGVKLTGFSPKEAEAVAGTTRITVVVAVEEIDNELLNYSSQVGAILPIHNSIFPKVRLIVSGEEVGIGQLGLFNEKLGIKITGA